MQQKEDEDEINGGRWKCVCSEVKGLVPPYCFGVWDDSLLVCRTEKNMYKGCAVN